VVSVYLVICIGLAVFFLLQGEEALAVHIAFLLLKPCFNAGPVFSACAYVSRNLMYVVFSSYCVVAQNNISALMLHLIMKPK